MRGASTTAGNAAAAARAAIAATVVALTCAPAYLISTSAEARLAGPAPRDEGRLFRIVKDGVPDSFVLGTIHAADPRTSTLSAPISAALSQSRMLAVEMIPEAHDQELQEFEYVEKGSPRLPSLMDSSAYARLRTALVEQGMAPEVVDRLKPWAAMMRIARAYAKSSTLIPMDQLIYVEARRRRLNIQPLEMVDEQVAAFDNIPLDSQVALLLHALDHHADLVARAEQTITAWLRGDLDAIARIAANDDGRFRSLRPHYARLIEHVIEGRTALMHHRLLLPLRSGRVLVAIGAMHLHGRKGLLALLRGDGYRIAKVW